MWDGRGLPVSTLTHLQRLEAESIHIMREVVAEADNPVMLYSIGKDSAVMLHLARKAFFPSPPPFNSATSKDAPGGVTSHHFGYSGSYYSTSSRKGIPEFFRTAPSRRGDSPFIPSVIRPMHP